MSGTTTTIGHYPCAAGPWQPGPAPKDGQWILGYFPFWHPVEIVSWRRNLKSWVTRLPNGDIEVVYGVPEQWAPIHLPNKEASDASSR